MAIRKKKIRIVNGRSYQVNKKWSELSQIQKRWILADAKYHYEKSTADTGQPITNREKRKLLHKVFQRIRSKGIWIPFSEVGRVVSSRIRKWNRRMTARQSAGMSTSTIKILPTGNRAGSFQYIILPVILLDTRQSDH